MLCWMTNETRKYLDTPMNELPEPINNKNNPISDTRTSREFLTSLIEDAKNKGDLDGVKCLTNFLYFFEQSK